MNEMIPISTIQGGTYCSEVCRKAMDHENSILWIRASPLERCYMLDKDREEIERLYGQETVVRAAKTLFEHRMGANLRMIVLHLLTRLDMLISHYHCIGSNFTGEVMRYHARLILWISTADQNQKPVVDEELKKTLSELDQRQQYDQSIEGSRWLLARRDIISRKMGEIWNSTTVHVIEESRHPSWYSKTYDAMTQTVKVTGTFVTMATYAWAIWSAIRFFMSTIST